MDIKIKSTQIEVTGPLKEYIEKRLSPISKLVKRFETKTDLILNVEVARTTKHHSKGDVYYVELSLNGLGKSIRIEQNDKDVRASIDKAQKRLWMEVEKIKEKKQERDNKAIDSMKMKV